MKVTEGRHVVAAAVLVICLLNCAIAVDVQYLCNGECSGDRTGCSCDVTCEANKNCCTDYDKVCKGGTSWEEDPCATEEEMTCPPGFEEAPVILLSIDAFRNIYLYRNITKNMMKLAECGAHSPYMRPVYPSKTFTSHYSAATGLFAESHGIIDNKIYDPGMNKTFKLGDEEMFNPAWWKGEPIWVTPQKYGKKTAAMYYPGTDVNITMFPTYYYVYNESDPIESRFQQVFKWLDMPIKDRPEFIITYSHTVDHGGHDFGPFSLGVDATISEMDSQMGMLMDGLKQRQLHNCVNLIVVADHGMASTGCERMTFVEDYGVSLDNLFFRGGSFARFGPGGNEQAAATFDPVEVVEQLRCQRSETHWQAMLKYEYLPRRFHYAFNDRIEDIHLKMDDEWLVDGNEEWLDSWVDKGSHGYDNEFVDVRAIFIGHGSSFKRSFNSSEGFDNIELYNMIADLLNVSASPNNGTKGSLYHFMTSPNAVEIEAKGVAATTCLFPQSDLAADKAGCAYCQGISEEKANQRLKLENDAVDEIASVHLLLKLPRVSESDKCSRNFCVLSQEDYVNVYDNNRKQPLFIVFTKYAQGYEWVYDVTCMRPDIRVNNSTRCDDYANKNDKEQLFLYNPALSSDETRSDATLTTNTFSAYNGFARVWKYMSKTINHWSEKYKGVYVAMGPVFDYNFDGLADDDGILETFGSFLDEEKTIPISTHLFLILTKCKDSNNRLQDCIASPTNVDVLAFIIPNFKTELCHSEGDSDDDFIPKSIIEHIARVKDVELITGLRFFTKWSAEATDQDILTAAIRQKVYTQDITAEWLSSFQTQNLQSVYPTMTTTTDSALLMTSQLLIISFSLFVNAVFYCTI